MRYQDLKREIVTKKTQLRKVSSRLGSLSEELVEKNKELAKINETLNTTLDENEILKEKIKKVNDQNKDLKKDIVNILHDTQYQERIKTKDLFMVRWVMTGFISFFVYLLLRSTC